MFPASPNTSMVPGSPHPSIMAHSPELEHPGTPATPAFSESNYSAGTRAPRSTSLSVPAQLPAGVELSASTKLVYGQGDDSDWQEEFQNSAGAAYGPKEASSKFEEARKQLEEAEEEPEGCGDDLAHMARGGEEQFDLMSSIWNDDIDSGVWNATM